MDPVHVEHSVDPVSADDKSEVPVSPVADPDELELLAKLQQANRMLEADSKSLHSLSPNVSQKSLQVNGGDSKQHSGHSRQGSISSILSNNSFCSTGSGLPYDDANQDTLWALWGSIIADWDNTFKRKSSQIKDLVRKGIPHHFRGLVWQLLCGARDCPEKDKYAEYLKMTSPFEKTISRDITRTFPSHDLFKKKDGIGQESLFNVMKAYSLYDREVGYCQGSGFIVGLLLMQMPEEEAFCVLVKIMSSFNLRELFKPSMTELGLRMYQLESMVQDLLPELYNHFQAHGVTASMFASSWFLALFTTILPLPVACRVFDVFLSEGVEVIFRVGLAILQLNLDELLSLDMEEMIKFLQKDLSVKVESDPDLLLATTFQIKLNGRKMKKLEKEYIAMKTKEQEEQVELRRVMGAAARFVADLGPRDHISQAMRDLHWLPVRQRIDFKLATMMHSIVYSTAPEYMCNKRLRTENKLLQQRVVNLEKETETLADRLIHDQVRCAQQDEEICILRQRLVIAKQQQQQQQTCESSPKITRSLVEAGESTTRAPRPNFLWQATDDTATSVDKDEAKIQQLQKELDFANETVLRLREKVTQLENAQNEIDANTDISTLHEDLIACKLREAEANMAIKELQHQLFEVEKHWQRYRERARQNADDRSSSTAAAGGGSSRIQQLSDAVMAAQIREASLISEMTDLKQRLVLLEQQSHICERRSRRMEDELKTMKKKLAEAEIENKRLQNQLEETIVGHAAKQKESIAISKLRDSEHLQLVTDMRRRIAELEIQNHELNSASQRESRVSTDGDQFSKTWSPSTFDLHSVHDPQGSSRHIQIGIPASACARSKPTAAVVAHTLRASTAPDIDNDRTPTNDNFNVETFASEKFKQKSETNWTKYSATV